MNFHTNIFYSSSGYSCGAQCTATGTGGQTQVAGKVAPSAASNVGMWMWPMVAGAAAVGIGMIIL